jgi:flavin reductase (DIM6/NTAB) family NADH-FMN oxidoreductase RutF
MSDTPVAIFRRLTTGVYVIGVANKERANGFTAAWLTQVSFDPLLVVLGINPENASFALLHESGGFVVNVLKREQRDLADRFGTQSGRDKDKLSGIGWRPGRTGAPILNDALAYLDCELTGRMRAGDHDLVLGRVVDGRILDQGATPLTYAETKNLDGSADLYPERFGT